MFSFDLFRSCVGFWCHLILTDYQREENQLRTPFASIIKRRNFTVSAFSRSLFFPRMSSCILQRRLTSISIFGRGRKESVTTTRGVFHPDNQSVARGSRPFVSLDAGRVTQIISTDVDCFVCVYIGRITPLTTDQSPVRETEPFGSNISRGMCTVSSPSL